MPRFVSYKLRGGSAPRCTPSSPLGNVSNKSSKPRGTHYFPSYGYLHRKDTGDYLWFDPSAQIWRDLPLGWQPNYSLNTMRAPYTQTRHWPYYHYNVPVDPASGQGITPPTPWWGVNTVYPSAASPVTPLASISLPTPRPSAPPPGANLWTPTPAPAPTPAVPLTPVVPTTLGAPFWSYATTSPAVPPTGPNWFATQTPVGTDGYNLNTHLAYNPSFPEELVPYHFFTTFETLTRKNRVKNSRMLEQPASTPMVREMQLIYRTVSHGPLNVLFKTWGPIVVRASSVDANTSNTFGHEILVKDVVKAMDEYFNTPLTWSEITWMRPDAQYHVWSLQNQRMEAYRKDDKPWRENDPRRHLIRADLLNGYVEFAGIEKMSWDDYGKVMTGQIVLKQRST